MLKISTPQALNLARQYHQAGHLKQAEILYRQVVEREPGNAHALHILGVIAHESGHRDAAIEHLTQAISITPSVAEYHSTLGGILHALGRRNEAIAAFQQAIVLKPDYPEVYLRLGNALIENGQLDDAIVAFQKAITLKPDLLEAHNNLGNAFAEKSQFAEAITAFKKCVSLKPDFHAAYINLGTALLNNHQANEAISPCEKAIALNPKFAEAHQLYGMVLAETGQLDEAITAFRTAIRIRPDFAEAHTNLGNALLAKGEVHEAIGAYRAATKLRPDFPMAHWNLAVALLLAGELAEGFNLYEWRWESTLTRYKRNFAQSLWDGSDLAGRTILLHAEQGLGDTLHFIRYVPQVVQRGGRVLVECQKELVALFQDTPGIDQVIVAGEPLPAFDVHCPLLSLPLALDTTLQIIPASVPYVTADAGRIAEWSTRLRQDTRRKVGIAWAGRPDHTNNRHRSCSLETFADLAKIPGVVLYSLQKGPAADQAKSPPVTMEVINLTDDLQDFADTAALIANLDLVISVDTAVVHLAGAMDKPVWTLLPFAPDWRWLLDRSNSPWYPTMRLFRQPKIGDWDAVMQQVAHALNVWVSEAIPN